MHDKHKPEAMNGHSNTFVDLNGIPYIYAEYMDRSTIRQIDRSMIRSEIILDTHEDMRKVVNISVNDIGNRASDGSLNTKGNHEKTRRLLGMIADNFQRLDHLLDVMKRGLVLKVNYQLEDASTGYIISTMSDEFRTQNRSYYADITSKNIDDLAIISLFNDSMVTCINEFVHGHRNINVRIVSIDMFYEIMARIPKGYSNYETIRPHAYPAMLPTMEGPEFDYYKYHQQMQTQHLFCPTCYDDHGAYSHSKDLMPPTWMNFNRFYHFDEECNSIILHQQEIDDPRCTVIKIPCGKIQINRLMRVHPGTRVVYNFMIWKNDITVVNDAMLIARELQSPTMRDHRHDHEHTDDRPEWSHGCNQAFFHGHNPDHDLDKETILRMLYESRDATSHQNRVINQLNEQIQNLQTMIKNMPAHDCDCCTPNEPPDEEPELENVVTIVDDVAFESVQGAIEAIEAGEVHGPIVLQADVEEELTIYGKVTINLNGHKISAPVEDDSNFHHTITVDGGTLTINGDGEVINGNSQGYCVFNAGYADTWLPYESKSEGMGQGVVTLNGGKYYRSGDDDEHRGYVIVNHGAMMTINEGVDVDVARDDSSLVTNGFMGSPMSCPVMIINGGHFRGGRHTINNDHGGRLVINGGMFIMGTPWSDVDDFSVGPKNVLRNEDQGVAKITGGKFLGAVENSNDAGDSLVISGGKFTVNVSNWLDLGCHQKPDGTVLKG